MIFTGFQPNATKEDCITALSFLLLPWKWFSLRKGQDILQVEEQLKKYFSVLEVITFDSGRTALQKGLEALQIRQGNEVLVQAYTCVVVINAIKWAGGIPVYVDVNQDLNMDQQDLKRKITSNTKVLIIQHTFGKAAQLKELLQIAREHNLEVIEDCAHTIGGTYNGKKLGTFGDIGILSFGSDKAISCVRGGALITNNVELGKKISVLQSNLPLSTRTKVFQHLAVIPLFALLKPLYTYGIGKWLLLFFKKLNITGRIIYEKEKKGKQLSFYPSKLPNALAIICLDQLRDLDKMNQKRKLISDIYKNSLVCKATLPQLDKNTFPLRFNLLVKNPEKIHMLAKKEGIVLGNWYDSVIAPADAGIEHTDYVLGSCPKAENFATRSINLPTHRNISSKDAKKIIRFINTTCQ